MGTLFAGTCLSGGGRIAALLVLLAVLGGCGGEGRIDLHGRVTCGGQKVEIGEVRFVPLDTDDGPARSVYRMVIVEGQYQTGADYGLPYGEYRVEVDARKKTGRKTMVSSGLERIEADETIPIGPEAHAGSQSPLRFEASSRADSRFDIQIPTR